MRNWINLIETVGKDFVTEKYETTILGIRNAQVEIFRNPSTKEWKSCQGHDEVRAFIVGDDLLIWQVYGAVHQMVRDALKLPDTAIPVTIMGDLGGEVLITVTDNAKPPILHNPSIRRMILTCPFVKKRFRDVEIGFFDEAIVGDWRNIGANINEDVVSLSQHRTNKAIGAYADAVGGIVGGEAAFFQTGKFLPFAQAYIASGYEKDFRPEFFIDVSFRDFRPSPEAREILKQLRSMGFKSIPHNYAKDYQGTKEGPFLRKEGVSFEDARDSFQNRDHNIMGAYCPSLHGFRSAYQQNFDENGIGFSIFVAGMDPRRGEYGKDHRYEYHIVDNDQDWKEVLAMMTAINSSRITEGVNDKFLYHGTDLVSAIAILQQNKLESSQEYEHDPMGVSLTREYWTAREFGTYWERQYPVVLVLDAEKLRQSRLKVLPRRDTTDRADEYRSREAEEMVLGDITPLSQFLVSVNINPLACAHAIADPEYLKWMVEEKDYLPFCKSPRALKAAITAFSKSALLNRVRPRVADHFERGKRMNETYGRNNSDLLQHLKSGEFDYYRYWWYIAEWAIETDNLDLFDVPDQTDFQEDPETFAPLYEKLPEWAKDEARDWTIDYLTRHEPSELPSSQHFSLQNVKLLPRTTWLIHFTDHAHDIMQRGFRVGVPDMDGLGLTTYTSHEAKSIYDGGYNFAFLAQSRDADFAAQKKKYGRDAILFQNAGVHTYHYGDEENQVIFYGPDVNTNSLIYLRQEYGDWYISDQTGNKKLIEGDFEKVVSWAISNYAQYRQSITRDYPRIKKK